MHVRCVTRWKPRTTDSADSNLRSTLSVEQDEISIYSVLCDPFEPSLVIARIMLAALTQSSVTEAKRPKLADNFIAGVCDRRFRQSHFLTGHARVHTYMSRPHSWTPSGITSRGRRFEGICYGQAVFYRHSTDLLYVCVTQWLKISRCLYLFDKSLMTQATTRTPVFFKAKTSPPALNLAHCLTVGSGTLFCTRLLTLSPGSVGAKRSTIGGPFQGDVRAKSKGPYPACARQSRAARLAGPSSTWYALA